MGKADKADAAAAQYTPQEVEAFLREDTLDAEAAQLANTGSIGAATAGIFKTDESPKTAEELRVLADEAIAEDVRERAGGT